MNRSVCINSIYWNVIYDTKLDYEYIVQVVYINILPKQFEHLSGYRYNQRHVALNLHDIEWEFSYKMDVSQAVCRVE